ncbi:MAG: hypothetical protein RL748_1921 [Pseudomonadota bacterium]|jgi:flagellar biosynthetic protein FliR
MRLTLDLAPVALVFLLSLRLAAVFFMTPVFSNLTRLNTVRVLFTLAMSVTLVLGLGLPVAKVDWGLGSLLLAAILEVVLGATLAFGVFAAFGVFSLAGKLLDIQSGFGLGTVFDPVTRASAPVFSSMLNLLALAVFFALDGHHAMMRGLAYSVQQVPPGSSWSGLPLEAVLKQFGLMFSLALALVAPCIFALFLVEVGTAVLSRALPQMNVLVLGVSLKIVVALVIFALSLGSALPLMGRIYASIFLYWEQVLT